MTRAKILVCLLVVCFAPAGQAAQQPRDLTEISLEELMNIEVVSVSKKQQRLSEVAAAVYVITQEDIRRSGATCIPEVLRMAPGVQVARIDSSLWAITARGFNGRFANKLLVLMDGRSVYHPLFSGVYWNLQDTLLEDIERIEVIRGPGATMWGANAVNGVINIITKSAARTQGGLVTAGGGSEERSITGVRYGGRIGAQAHYRAYAKHFQRNELPAPSGQPASEDWGFLRGGFRLDVTPSRRDSLMLEGDLFIGHTRRRTAEPSLAPPFSRLRSDDSEPAGGNVLGRWSRKLSDTETELQVYFDRWQQNSVMLGETVSTVDLDFHSHWRVRDRHELAWGCAYRLTSLELGNRVLFSYDPARRRDSLFSAFLEDNILLSEDRLALVVGSKFEHNPFSGFEIQPTVRLAWTPQPRHSAWLAASRAVRMPSPTDQNVRINLPAGPSLGGTVALVSWFGSPDIRSENLLAYEVGYRVRPLDRVTLDAAGFYNFYDHLRDIQWGTPYREALPAPPHLVVPAYFRNNAKAESYGVEIAANWQPAARWRLAGSYTGLALRLRRAGAHWEDAMLHGDNPGHQVGLRSSWDLSRTVQFDSALYYVGALASLGVPAYTRVDAHLGWHPARPVELSLALSNLLDPRHPEYIAEGRDRMVEIGRSIHGRITWRF